MMIKTILIITLMTTFIPILDFDLANVGIVDYLRIV